MYADGSVICSLLTALPWPAYLHVEEFVSRRRLFSLLESIHTCDIEVKCDSIEASNESVLCRREIRTLDLQHSLALITRELPNEPS